MVSPRPCTLVRPDQRCSQASCLLLCAQRQGASDARRCIHNTPFRMQAMLSAGSLAWHASVQSPWNDPVGIALPFSRLSLSWMRCWRAILPDTQRRPGPGAASRSCSWSFCRSRGSQLLWGAATPVARLPGCERCATGQCGSVMGLHRKGLAHSSQKDFLVNSEPPLNVSVVLLLHGTQAEDDLLTASADCGAAVKASSYNPRL